MANFPRDENRVPTIGGVSSLTEESPKAFEYDPDTGGLTVHIVGSEVDALDISDVASSFEHGSNRDVDTSAEQITSTSITATRGVLVKAANANTGTIYVGNSDVTAGTTDATDGFELGAGESILVKVDNANKVYVIASTTNQIVYWMVV